MKKIMISIGTRPEAIKLLPLVSLLRDAAQLYVLFTGQHKEIAEDVFSLFSERFDRNLSVMGEGKSLSLLSSDILLGASEYIEEISPSICVVQGDTVSAYSVAYAAFLSKIKIAHVEAGLRTGDLTSPYPEEYFRRSISLMASLHFAPDEYSRDNLLSESVPSESIFVTGNTVIDAVRRFAKPESHKSSNVIFTLHRRESRGAYSRILSSVADLALEYKELTFIAVMHPSSEVRMLFKRHLCGIDNIILIEPLSLPDFYGILASACLVLTDSGGVSEEAAILGIPTIVLRDKTEREREVCEGRIILAGADGVSLSSIASKALKIKTERPRLEPRPSERIRDIILDFIK